LSNAVSFRVPGDSNSLTWNPCCLYNDYLPYHPTSFKKQHQKFVESDKEFLPGCSKCELKEKTHNGISQRIIFNKDIPDGLDDNIYKLEIVLDTTCNAACIQCGEMQSSLWRNEVASRDKNYIHIQPEGQIDRKIADIKKSIDLTRVKEFHFWGGEPLLTDTHLKFLREVADPENVVLAYTTNASIVPDDETLRLWEKFKSIRIGMSIDAMHDQFHYIRWPLGWDKIVRNLEQFKSIQNDNTIYHINCCILPLNVLYVEELNQWLKTNFNINKNGKPINFNFIRGEGKLDIACTPMSLREEIWSKFGEDHTASKILKELPVLNYNDMISHLNYWDKIRKLDWRVIFPEVSRHFI
jgi:sulfatase maturation enzyme AslB (radical SAM superfamily)